MATTRSGGDLDGSVDVDTVPKEYSIKYTFLASVGPFVGLFLIFWRNVHVFTRTSIVVEPSAAVCNEHKLSFKIDK